MASGALWERKLGPHHVAYTCRPGTGPSLNAYLRGQPRPMPRPRGGKGQRAYVPKGHPIHAYVEEWLTLLQHPEVLYPVGPVQVEVVWYVKFWRGDGDNMEKTVLDVLKKALVYTDDRQVRDCRWCWYTLAETGRLHECTELAVRPLYR